jgi:hypothetical protein
MRFTAMTVDMKDIFLQEASQYGEGREGERLDSPLPVVAHAPNCFWQFVLWNFVCFDFIIIITARSRDRKFHSRNVHAARDGVT